MQIHSFTPTVFLQVTFFAVLHGKNIKGEEKYLDGLKMYLQTTLEVLTYSKK